MIILHIDDTEADTLRLALEKLRDDSSYSPIVGYKCSDLIRKINGAGDRIS